MKNSIRMVLFIAWLLCQHNLCATVYAQEHHSKKIPHPYDTLNLHEVVVEGRQSRISLNSVSAQLDQRDIRKAIGKSLAQMLEQTSGMSSLQTGTTVSKPVINGMYGNRILIVHNGARLTGQQWGADHAPEVDKNAFTSVSVVKGSESLRYGSEALGGIILMEQSPLPYDRRQAHGGLTTYYGSNGRRYAVTGHAEGTFPFAKAMAWRVHGTWENAGDRSTAHYLLNNTGTREQNLSATLGYRKEHYRIEAGYSLFNQKIGVMKSAQMGNEQLLQERIALGRPVETTPFSRAIDYPNQRIQHHTAFLKAYLQSDKAGQFAWQTTFQQDDRRENRIRRMNHSDIPTVSLHLISLLNSLHWTKAYQGWKTEAGAQLLHTRNSNERGTGVVPIIPNYTEQTAGLYALQKYMSSDWSAEAGVRYDFQRTKADGYDWTGRRYGGNRPFHNVTYNVGGHYHPNQHWTLTSNFGVAWRAPHVYELYSNGNELSAGTFVRGDSTLNSEQSYKWVTSVDYKSTLLCVRVDGYLQWINHYIYDAPTGQNITVVSGAYPVFQYQQTSALFRGIDLDVHVHPLPALDYHFVSSLIWAHERSTGNYLPYIPSARLTHSLSYQHPLTARATLHLGLTHRFVARQKRFNPASDLVDHTPPAYHLLGAEVGLEYQLPRGQRLHLNLMGDNLLNKEYKEYTNRSRYYAHDMGRDLRASLTWTF